MKIEKKHIVIAAISLVSITAAVAYAQYKRLMNYSIKFKKMKVNKVTQSVIDIDLFMLLKNKSNIKFDIKEQDYTVYINNVLVTKIVNRKPTIILPNTESEVPANISFNPQVVLSTLKKGLLDTVLNSQGLKIKIDIKLKVSLWFFTVNIPYIYETTLKEIMSVKSEKV